MERNKSMSILLLLPLILLYFLLSVGSASLTFLESGIIYITIILLSSFLIKKGNRQEYLSIVLIFTTVYSLFCIISHFVFITNPYQDFYINLDETKFIGWAEDLSHYSYGTIWEKSFTEFEYSGFPLFAAWIGTLQKFTGLNLFYGLLFQKLNVAFFGSFIPGIIFLLCRRITNRKNAFKAAIAYGLLTFTFFYSVGLMRDIHISLIYAIGLFIITGYKYNLKNYILLGALGLAAYFIRLENGLFFIAFIGIWALNSESRYKILILPFSIAILAGIIIYIGGLDLIYQQVYMTSTSYTEQAINRAGDNSLGVLLNRLPVPFNYLSKTAIGQIVPFPFWIDKFDSNNLIERLFYIPYAIAGLFWFLVWTRILVHGRKTIQVIKSYKWIIILALIYIIAVSAGQANPRRLMAIYPALFMIYMLIDRRLFRLNEIAIALLSYALLLIIYAGLKVIL